MPEIFMMADAVDSYDCTIESSMISDAPFVILIVPWPASPL